MTKQQMIDLVERYFQGVDAMNFGTIAETLDDECILTVETHRVQFQGIVEIEQMFRRLWHDHAAVSHQDFFYVPDPDEGRIATQFSVVNTHHDGSKIHKSNCNFFEIHDSRFCRISIYMAGDNTLIVD
jgi:hypothetical protein